MATDLSAPRDGIPPVLTTPAEFDAAAALLDTGTGPIAIDTERASGFRYNDRAFLIQLRRRGVGTLLLDPESHRGELSHYFAPALNGQEWIIHAAATDLPSLAWLGFHPGRLFDTELAGRLAGFDHVNLAAMIDEIFDLHLAKGHGAEDWSVRPLPEEWLNYAALDVEMLLELADVMAELLDNQGKLEWAEEEFQHIQDQFADVTDPPDTSWRDLKGISLLRRPEQLVVARELWLERERIAAGKDIAVGRVLPNKVLIEIARSLPSTPDELRRIKGFPGRNAGAVRRWGSLIKKARASSRSSWPKAKPRQRSGVPDRRNWSSDWPEEYATLLKIRGCLDDLGADLAVPAENLIQPTTLRTLVWMAVHTHQITDIESLDQAMRDHHVRPWQRAVVTTLLVDVLFSSRR